MGVYLFLHCWSYTDFGIWVCLISEHKKGGYGFSFSILICGMSKVVFGETPFENGSDSASNLSK